MLMLFTNYYFKIQLNYINVVNLFVCFFLLFDLIISKYLYIKFDISKFIHHIVALYYYFGDIISTYAICTQIILTINLFTNYSSLYMYYYKLFIIIFIRIPLWIYIIYNKYNSNNIFFNILYCMPILLDTYWSYLIYKNIISNIHNLSSLFVGEYNMFRYKLIDSNYTPKLNNYKYIAHVNDYNEIKFDLSKYIYIHHNEQYLDVYFHHLYYDASSIFSILNNDYTKNSIKYSITPMYYITIIIKILFSIIRSNKMETFKYHTTIEYDETDKITNQKIIDSIIYKNNKYQTGVIFDIRKNLNLKNNIIGNYIRCHKIDDSVVKFISKLKIDKNENEYMNYINDPYNSPDASYYKKLDLVINSYVKFKYPNYIETLEKVYFNNSVDVFKNQMIIIKKADNKYDFLYNDNNIII